MLRKVNYIFDKQQKIKLMMLFVGMFIGGFTEMLGVSLILPLVTIIMEPDIMYTNDWIAKLCGWFDIKTNSSLVLFLLLVLITVYILKNIYLVILYDLQYRFTYNNQRRISLRLMTCYIKQDYLFHLSKNTSELQRNVTTDVNQFFSMVLDFILMMSEIITCLFLVAFLMYTDVTTTIGVAVIVCVFCLFFYMWFRKSLVKAGNEYRLEYAKMLKWIQQSFGGIKEVKVMSCEQYFLVNYDKCYKKVADRQKKQSLMRIIPKPILESICICGVLSVMIIRVIMKIDLTASVPLLSVFAMAAFRMLPAFSRITAYMGEILFSKSSVDAVYADLKEIEKLTAKKEEETLLEVSLNEKIIIRDVSFRYPNTETYVLKNVRLEIPVHQSVALIGPSGAGKTTLADIILGLLKPENGNVMVDGIDIFKNLRSWHRILGYIPQNIYLMDDTIRNNVTFGIPEEEVNEEQIWKALQEAQLEAFVKKLDKGLNTIVGERGVRLSGGQRQRIGIARALYGNPQVLVLDEATSALDNETEAAVMEAIENLQGRKTIIIIAHRLTTIRNCDLIYEVNNGKIIPRDKKEVLNKKKG